jgi:hypothetical protein
MWFAFVIPPESGYGLFFVTAVYYNFISSAHVSWRVMTHWVRMMKEHELNKS